MKPPAGFHEPSPSFILIWGRIFIDGVSFLVDCSESQPAKSAKEISAVKMCDKNVP
jgi:hypothetical protein